MKSVTPPLKYRSVQKLQTIAMTAEVPVVREVDVLVAGGGMAGFGVALCAARNGAKTLLVERESALGGLVTLGLVCLPFSYLEGTAVEWFARLKQENAVRGRFLDPEKTKRIMEGMLLRDGVEILFNTMVIDAIVEGRDIRGVVVFNKGGRQAILAKRVVDASGDGDVSAQAGAPFENGSAAHEGYNQSTSLVMRVGNVDMARYAEALAQEKTGGGISDLWQDQIESTCIIRRNWGISSTSSEKRRTEKRRKYTRFQAPSGRFLIVAWFP